MSEAKGKLKDLNDNFRSEDKSLRDQHESHFVLEDKSRKLSELIAERKKEGGTPKEYSDGDIDEKMESLKILRLKLRTDEKSETEKDRTYREKSMKLTHEVR